jgi:hypothetical protein
MPGESTIPIARDLNLFLTGKKGEVIQIAPPGVGLNFLDNGLTFPG